MRAGSMSLLGVILAMGAAATPPAAAPAIQVYAQTGSRTYMHGNPVELILKIENTDTRPQTLRFSSAQQFDFVVSTMNRPIWRWSDGRVFAQSLTDLTLAPGESRRFSVQWSQQDRAGGAILPGIYEVTALVTSLPEPLRAQTHLEIH